MSLTITIDGKAYDCVPGEYLLEIATRNGIKIPTLCHHGGIPGQGCCRVCIVEVDIGGRSSIVTACIYPVESECQVFTDSERVKRQRGMVLALLRSRAPECAEVTELCETLSVPRRSRFTEQAGEKCILCGLCVGACRSIGTGAISTVNRGISKAVSTPYDEPSADCVGCASCFEVCDAGAIELTEDLRSRTIWNRTFDITLCEKCGEPMGTREELELAAEKAGTEVFSLCAICRRKAMTDVMAKTYGR
jgi:NADH dehydrogenase/NADH:ubiquinone oxidoreductase subunit G